VIARDWFRFAEHLEQNKKSKNIFLIYNRAWGGTREYRLKFADLAIEKNLQDFCQTTVNSVDPELQIHYNFHNFINPNWKPNTQIEQFFPQSVSHSSYSADFEIKDYESTDIEIVLETLFDDSRIHLTEKSLRPIACGQPFIIAGTAGSLQYLKSYGFQTFSDVWDESYDHESDSVKRLEAVTNLMKDISQWSSDVRKDKLKKAQQIAQHNKQHFFSQQFMNQIILELKQNLNQGFEELNQCNNIDWLNRWDLYTKYPEINRWLDHNNDPTLPNRDAYNKARAIIEQRNRLWVSD